MKKIIAILFGSFSLFCFSDAQNPYLSSDLANFSIIFTNETDSVKLTVTNPSADDYVVDDIELYHGDAFYLTDTAFIVPASSTYDLWIYCHPRHNIKYGDQLILSSPSHPVQLNAFVFAYAKYPDPYWDATQNLWNEDLKTALKTTISTGATDLGYNGARDAMYMTLDNQKVNGMGATQNTLECVYTGIQAVGYISRADAQTNYNFNTEHTFPQSFFGSVSPMLSDLFHLYPTDANANSERANKPFGVVTSPSWSVGGSKSNATTFEPRDVHKGDVARALFYFVIRYQDYSGFVAPQEATLRQWCATFLPDSTEIRRDSSIFNWQNNHNPFIVHPEFLERIASVTTVDNGTFAADIHYISDTLYYMQTNVGDSTEGFCVISNQGNDTMDISSLVLTGADFSMDVLTSFSLAPDSSRTIPVRFRPSSSGIRTGLINFSTNDPQAATGQIVLNGEAIISATDELQPGQTITVYPNPASGKIYLEIPAGKISASEWEIVDLAGRKMTSGTDLGKDAANGIEIGMFPAGEYLLVTRNGENAIVKRIIRH